MAATTKTEKLDFEKVWLLVQETAKRFQETDKKFQETDRQMKETDKKLRQLEELFTSQWGKLMEKLVEGDLLKLLNARGLKANFVHSRTKGTFENKKFEFDLIAVNGDEIVVVEVKTTLRPDDVKDFIKNLKLFKQIFPKYNDNKIYGAVAYLTTASKSEIFAEQQGLLVIRATGSSASIVNSPDFIPKAW